MDRLISLFDTSLLDTATAVFSAAGIAVLICILIYVLYRRKLRNRIEEEAKRCVEYHPAFRSSCSFTVSRKTLARNFPTIRSLSQRYGLNLVVLTKLDDYWVDKIERSPSIRLFKRALSYSPDKCLFPCFRSSLEKKRFRSILREWMEKSGEFMIMRSIASSCAGRDFDGRAALEAYGDFKEELYQMTGDHEWKNRWFAYSILIHDKDERSVRSIWESFGDTSYRVREKAAELYSPDDSSRESFYIQLLSLLLDDPEYRVRKTARNRIERDFSDLYTIPEKLSYIQKLHLAEFLNPQIEEDRKFAFTLLDSNDEELTFEAARLLSKAGSLKRLFLDVFHEDRDSLDRAAELLLHSARVHCTGFLSALEETTNPGTLLLATKILSHYGDRKHITTLVQKVRAFGEEQKKTLPLREVYRQGLLCACTRGDDTSLHLLAHELTARRGDVDLHNRILPELPIDKAHVYIGNLIDYLSTPAYPAKERLRSLLSRIEPSFTLPQLFELIKTEDENIHPIIQEEALKVLCELELPYTVQHLLEHLPLLSISQANRYTELISSYNRETYTERVKYLLSTSDARIRSRIISSLPSRFFSDFHYRILESVGDPDPEVRSAAAWCLVTNGSEKDHAKVLSLLHDPVHEVRVEAARAIATHTVSAYSSAVIDLLEDPNELLPVKRSAIEGLAESREEKSVDVLVAILAEENELEGDVVRAISQKSGTAMITRILSHVEQADQRIRRLLIQALKSMGESAETVLESLVFDLDSILRDVTVEILEKIGSVDSRIRHLTNRDVSVRREAAAFLAHVGTKNAYRGLVLAAKDPDDEVRAHVVRALDALDSDKGRSMLEELREDADRRVRTLTEWAIERHRSRRL